MHQDLNPLVLGGTVAYTTVKPNPLVIAMLGEALDPIVERVQVICSQDKTPDEKAAEVREFFATPEAKLWVDQHPEALQAHFPALWERFDMAMSMVAAPYC